MTVEEFANFVSSQQPSPKEKKDEFGYTKSQNRQIEKYLTSPRYRPETTMERINRIGYEHGEKGFEKKPKDLSEVDPKLIETYNKCKVNISFSGRDACPRVISESCSCGCFNIALDTIYATDLTA